MSSNRVNYIDCLRVYAGMLVVAGHCNYMPDNPVDRIFSQILGVIGAPSSELFLAISGSLLIPVHTSQSAFYKRRFAKLLPPFLFWSLFGLVFALITSRIGTDEIGFMLFSLPFTPAILSVYWFMYSIIGMYLLAPIISPYILQGGGGRILFLLGLWAISLILPLGNLFYDGFYNTNGDYKYMLSTFSGYPGYMILGYYLRKYPLKITNKSKGWLVLLIGIFLMMLLIAFVGFRYPHNRDYVLGNLSFVNAVIVVLYFSFFQALFKKESVITKEAQKLTRFTFGIYLVHIFVIYFVQRFFEPMQLPFSIMMIVVPISSFVVSFSLVWLLSQIKYTSWCVQGITIKK